MMNLKPVESNPRQITPIRHPLSARVNVPGSKSHTNRALLVSALATSTTTLQNALFSEDSQYLSSALRELGFDMLLQPKDKTMTVNGLGGVIPKEKADLFIGNAGTAARFLTAMLTLGKGAYTLDGNPRMRQRPMGDLVGALNQLGSRVSGTQTGNPNMSGKNPELYPPITIQADGLKGGRVSIKGDISSQYLSALLMAAPYAEETVEIFIDGPLNSKPYIDLTLAVMADFGVAVYRDEYACFKVNPQVYRSQGDYMIESDASAASYFFAAPAVCGGWVEVRGISQEDRQGDLAFLNILAEMGCSVTGTDSGVRVTGTDRMMGVEVDMSDISDTSITLAVIAPFASSPTTIRGIASSRVKESDRIAATCTELRRLGIQVEEHFDGLTIHPCETIQPGRIRTYDDHRIAMAFALMGLKIQGIEIENPGCVAKTFPDYFQVLDSLQ